MREFFKNTDINFLGKRQSFYLLSIILLSIGLIALVQISRGKGNLGIDFAGGAAVQLKFEQPISINEARRALRDGGLPGTELQEITRENKLIIRIKKKDIVQKNIRGQIKSIISKSFSGNSFIIESSTEIGPTIGKKLQRDALWAIAISLIGIVSFIAYRFQFQFGIAAAIAAFHDVLVVLGTFFLLDKEITLLTVTALLTIAGYSLNDTVVIFDRIRENLKARKKESFEQTINKTINDVLSRTFITSVTTFLAVAALYLFGGEVIHDFALAVLIGVVVGTYSSWFIASSLLVTWRQRSQESRVLKRA
ncbi:MAG: protein translocase subunit SecF [Nitrospira sp.]|nr:protein translocase subunit SecF [Candidatus Manganitrophaceae bacterium]HIL34182.1 protein translocase subunit SecF [Candidatus Manganitrophaceae bacterium]